MPNRLHGKLASVHRLPQESPARVDGRRASEGMIDGILIHACAPVKACAPEPRVDLGVLWTYHSDEANNHEETRGRQRARSGCQQAAEEQASHDDV